MRTLHTLAFIFTALLAPMTAVATAQIVPTGPFTGANSEIFHYSVSSHVACSPERILDGTADLCAAGGGELVIAGDSNCSCVMHPLGQLQALVFNGGHLRISFGTPAVRFGCYLGLNCNVADGHADFLDTNGMLLATLPLWFATLGLSPSSGSGPSPFQWSRARGLLSCATTTRSSRSIQPLTE